MFAFVGIVLLATPRYLPRGEDSEQVGLLTGGYLTSFKR